MMDDYYLQTPKGRKNFKAESDAHAVLQAFRMVDSIMAASLHRGDGHLIYAYERKNDEPRI